VREIASKLLQLGLSVVPIDRNRKSTPEGWGWKEFQSRYVTPSELDYFDTPGLDIGITTGPLSGIFVLDTDLQHPTAVEFMKGKHIPRTWTEKTKNGNHYYFRWTDVLESKKTLTRSILAEGVDTRGAGGLIKCAPSLGYSWIVSPFGTPLAPPPQWLVDLLPNKDDVAPTQATQPGQEPWMIESLNAMVDGDSLRGRNPTFLKVVNSLKRKGLEAAVVEAFLMPWAEKHNYTGKLVKLIQDQYKRYPAPKQETNDVDSDSLIQFMAETKPRKFFVPGLLAENTITVMAGLQESRKSWLLLDLAVSLASGTKWLDRHQVTRKKVLLIDQERPKDELQRRLKALLAARSLTFADLEGFLVPKVQTTFKINLERSYENLCRKIEDIKPDVILIDSLKTIQSLDVSSAEMQGVFERFKEMRNKFNLSIIMLHHLNKGAYEAAREGREVTAENIAGNSSINEVPEGIFVVTNTDAQSSTLHHVKNSYGLKQAPQLIRVEDIKPDQSQIVVRAY
jgi:hypothetical protein